MQFSPTLSVHSLPHMKMRHHVDSLYNLAPPNFSIPGLKKEVVQILGHQLRLPRRAGSAKPT